MIDAAIVGAGPVGLFCALALAHRGLQVAVLERDEVPRPATRSIGIHAPSLERLDRLGLAGDFVERGVRVRRGLAFDGDGHLIGSVDFRDASSSFPFALSLSQRDTEALLEAALDDRGIALLRGARLDALTLTEAAVVVHGRGQKLRARWVIGCDGRHSTVRSILGIPFRQRRCRGSYLMADFPDQTAFGSDAALFLPRAGLVESFPLPGACRRWVAQARGHRDHIDLFELCALVEARTGHRLDPSRARHPSAFGVEQGLAAAFRVGPAILIGDAAHAISPFGGQGMNLGWLDAWSLGAALIASTPRGASVAIDRWERARRRAARAAMRRAAFNTRVGRATRLAAVRNTMLQLALSWPLRVPLTRRFAMQGLA